MKEIYKMLIDENVNLKINKKDRGGYEEINVIDDYINFVSKNFKINRKLKVVVDASGGSTALFLPQFLEKLGIDYIPLFFEVDGSFSKHNPNPTLEESQKFVKEKIKETEADFGVIFDGDGDRMVVIDSESEYLRGDIIGAVIADILLKERDLFIYDTISTRSIKEYFEKRGTKSLRGKIGHYYIKKLMEEKGAVFALESSSHYYYKLLFNAESSFYSLRLLLEVLDKNPESKISDLVKPFLKYYGSGLINLPIKSQEKWDDMLKKVKDFYKDGRQNFDDGILVEFASWWFNLRPSHTEPLIRLVIEAKTEELMEEKKKEILDLLNSFV